MCGESCGCLPRSTLHAYALRSAVGTLSLSTRATVPQPGLFSCAFVGKLNGYWLVCVVSVDNELLRVSVEPSVGAALKCVLCLCLCRTTSLRNSRNIKDAYIGGHYIECVSPPYYAFTFVLRRSSWCPPLHPLPRVLSKDRSECTNTHTHTHTQWRGNVCQCVCLYKWEMF